MVDVCIGILNAISRSSKVEADRCRAEDEALFTPAVEKWLQAKEERTKQL
jgi:hypothetical protein